MEKAKLLSEIAEIEAKLAEGDMALQSAYNALKQEKLARIAEIDGVPAKKPAKTKEARIAELEATGLEQIPKEEEDGLAGVDTVHVHVEGDSVDTTLLRKK